MNSYKTELYKVSFGESKYDGLKEISIEKLNDESEWRTYYAFPRLCEYLVEMIYDGKMSQKEASKTIAKAMIHLTS